jgi:acetyltransferase-like isoleucine patch superfamily enzyme
MCTKQPAMTPQQEALSDTSRSGLSTYKQLMVGQAGFPRLLLNELIQGLGSWMPGLLGFAFRAVTYRWILSRCGRRPAIGKGATIRGGGQIEVGDGLVLDDHVTIDARGKDAQIEIANRVSVGRYSTIAAKQGRIRLEAGSNVGSYCRIATNSQISVGESVLIGAYCYIGPGNHTEEGAGALISNPMDIRGGVSIGAHAWLGARVTVLDGVSIGKHAIIGAHSLVTEDVPDWGVAVGTPAKVIKVRR